MHFAQRAQRSVRKGRMESYEVDLVYNPPIQSKVQIHEATKIDFTTGHRRNNNFAVLAANLCGLCVKCLWLPCFSDALYSFVKSLCAL